jgi:hypothetical protein
MPNRFAAALVIAPLLLTGCAHGKREAALNDRERASCERTIYHAADYNRSRGLRCAQLLGLWD